MKPFALLALVTCLPIFAQPRFDVAAIHLSDPGRQSATIRTEPGSLLIRNYTLHSCIEWAYNLRPLQVEGPEWLREIHIDIDARVENRQAEDDEFRLMLRTLLAERFGMKAHLIQKEQQVYFLTTGQDGPKFHTRGSKDGSSFSPSRDNGPSGFFDEKTGAAAQRVTMYQLANKLSERLNRIVIDKTGLERRYDLRIDITPYFTEGDDGPPDVMSIIFAGLNDQLGLRVEAGRELVELLTIDSIDTTPTAN